MVGSVIFDGPRYRLDAPGDVRGFDVRTGEELWEFHTIPQPGELGNGTWEDGSWEYSGATNAWGMLTADPELGYVYLPIGTPTNDYYGGHRLGDNLFAESIVLSRRGDRRAGLALSSSSTTGSGTTTRRPPRCSWTSRSTGGRSRRWRW